MHRDAGTTPAAVAFREAGDMLRSNMPVAVTSSTSVPDWLCSCQCQRRMPSNSCDREPDAIE